MLHLGQVSRLSGCCSVFAGWRSRIFEGKEEWGGQKKGKEGRFEATYRLPSPRLASQPQQGTQHSNNSTDRRSPGFFGIDQIPAPYLPNAKVKLQQFGLARKLCFVSWTRLVVLLFLRRLVYSDDSQA